MELDITEFFNACARIRKGLNMASAEQLAVMADHFIIAAIWADAQEGTHPRATKKARAAALRICTRFAELAGELLDEATQREWYGSHHDCGTNHPAFAAAGHDLYLTSQGHGVGFWDRDELDEGELGDKLTAVCESMHFYHEFYRGWLYFNGSDA